MDLFCSGFLLQSAPVVPVQNILKSASSQNEDINHLNYLFVFAAGFIFLSVVILTGLVIYRFRHQKTIDQPLRYASKKWEILTIGIPTALVIFFLISSIRTMNKILPARAGSTPDVVITGYQWWWKAVYKGGNVVAANEIHLPAGRPLLLKLLGGDVIHDWWVPELGNKMDMIPLRENYLWLNIKQPGTYYGICSEYCGAQHAHMQIRVIAQDSAAFEQWLQQNSSVHADTATAGARFFQEKTCGNCHRIGGTVANGTAGPDLTHIASRQTLLAGMLVNNKENLERWLHDPQKIKPGANMPKFILSDSAIQSLSNYLMSLK